MQKILLPCYEVKGYQLRIGARMFDIRILSQETGGAGLLSGTEDKIEIFRANGEQVR